MTPERREHVVACIESVARIIPNGPAVGDLRRASSGLDEPLLEAINLILQHHDQVKTT